jgi:hypothetical protein
LATLHNPQIVECGQDLREGRVMTILDNFKVKTFFLVIDIVIELFFASLCILSHYYLWQAKNQLVANIILLIIFAVYIFGIVLNRHSKIAEILLAMALILLVPLLFFDYFFVLISYTAVIVTSVKLGFFKRYYALAVLLLCITLLAIAAFTCIALLNETFFDANIFVFQRSILRAESHGSDGAIKYYVVMMHKNDAEVRRFSYLTSADVIDLYPIGRFYIKEKVINIYPSG